MVDDQDSQSNECSGDDQLQTVDHEDERTVAHATEDAQDRHTDSRHRDAEHDRHRTVEHPTLTTRSLQEDSHGREHQSSEQLVGGTEERPNIHVTGQAQEVAQTERQNGCKHRVREELLNGILFHAGSRHEEFLQAHATDTSHSVHTRQCQCGHAHRHDASGHVSGEAEDFRQEAGDGTGEQLEGRTLGQHTVGSGGADHDQSNNAQDRFHAHGTVTDQAAVLFIGDHLGRRTRRHEAVETGNGTASDRHKKHREEVHTLDVPTDECGHIDFRVLDEDAHDTTQDHAQEQEHAQVVTRLLQQPHRHDSGGKEVSEHDITPRDVIGVHRIFDTEPKHDDHQGDTDAQLFDVGGLTILQVKTESDGTDHVDHGDGGGSGVRNDLFARLGETVEGTGDHVTESGDHEQREKPAEQEEHLAARTTDVLLDHHAHGLTAVLDGSVQGCEVLDCAEEDTTEDHPQESGQPTEHRSDDRTGDGAGTGDGGELVREHRPLASGRIVSTVVHQLSRSFGLGIDAPSVFKPFGISTVTEEERHDGDRKNC